jgi:glycosyltransferase involved in cell wall biosynthesis
MLVSIITPTYNRPHLLLETLASIIRQSHPAWEALVVDDGDGSGLRAAQGLHEPRIRSFQNPRKGQVQARNHALEQARGEVIAWLDDDDWWEDPKHLERIVAILKNKAALLYRPGWMVRDLDHQARLWQSFNLPSSEASLYTDNTILTGGVAYPQTFHKELGNFDIKVGGYFDWDWYLRVLKAGYPLQVISQPGVCYRLHSHNASEKLDETRRRFFAYFCHKHGLELVMKNHQSLFVERTG